jgi:hypothetical protein
MRYVLLLMTLFILAGCETEAPKTAAVITKERAIAIAIEANKNPEFIQVLGQPGAPIPPPPEVAIGQSISKTKTTNSANFSSSTAAEKLSARGISRGIGTSKWPIDTATRWELWSAASLARPTGVATPRFYVRYNIARGSKCLRITIGHAPRPRPATAGAFRLMVPTASASQARQRSMILSPTRHYP